LRLSTTVTSTGAFFSARGTQPSESTADDDTL
jgi:hypothetical protein